MVAAVVGGGRGQRWLGRPTPKGWVRPVLAGCWGSGGSALPGSNPVRRCGLRLPAAERPFRGLASTRTLDPAAVESRGQMPRLFLLLWLFQNQDLAAFRVG